jgi:hypothetical protein
MTWSEGRNCDHFIPDELYEEYHRDFPPSFQKHIQKAINEHHPKLKQIADDEFPDPPQSSNGDKYKDLYKSSGSLLIDCVRGQNGFESINKIIHESKYLHQDKYDITKDQVQEYMGMKVLGNG